MEGSSVLSHCQLDHDDSPLPLSDLKSWVSEARYKWLEEADAKAAALKLEMEENAAASVTNLFGDDDEEGENETLQRRVHSWSSSKINLDGNVEGHCKKEDDSVSIVYVLSDSLAGFGDQVWASSRHISNLLANADTCRDVLMPFYSRLGEDEQKSNFHHHPLMGASFLELGAGAGVPSWTAMCCGARVVCTDQPDANRFRCIAECMERNWRNIKQAALKNGQSEANDYRVHGQQTKCCPYLWGTSINEVTEALNDRGEERFDVIVGADCVYMPWLHNELLDSINMFMSERGVALLPFALHGNTDDDDVWRIMDRAREKGFTVDTLTKAQLTPQGQGMDAKQGLVHTVRLTKK
jgi:Putative methyltransferase.